MLQRGSEARLGAAGLLLLLQCGHHPAPPACTAPHPACEHVPPYRNPSTVVWKSEPPRPSSIHPPTDARTHTHTLALQASLTCLCLSTCLPAHPPGRRVRDHVREQVWCLHARPASATAPEPAGRRLFALCRSARSRASPRLNVHCSPLTTASVRPATRLVLGESPHRRRWTPRCSEPGYGGVGVTVHPACDPSQPSVTQSDALPGQPKIPSCRAAAAARVLA